MGWSSLSVAMRYIHPSEDRVLEAISQLGGHNSGHTENARNLAERTQSAEVIDAVGNILVSAAGLEPATHALKGHCSTN
jgi:hypothetical protein